MSYYELTDDINFPNRWYLGDIAFADNWELAQHLDPEREYEVEVYRDGSEIVNAGLELTPFRSFMPV